MALFLMVACSAPLQGQDATTASASVQTTHYPPLCVEDVLGLLDQSMAWIGAHPEGLGTRERDLAVHWITSAREYSELLENRHSSLGAFSWLRLGTQRTLGRQVDGIVLPAPVSNVAALAFEATGGDIWVERVVVTRGDDTRTTTALTIKRWVFQDMPWTVVAFLPEGARVWEVVTDRRTWEGRADLILFGGVAGRGFQDHGRRALHFLERSENQLMRDNPEAALEALRQARDQMALFRQERMEQLRPSRSWIFGRTGRK